MFKVITFNTAILDVRILGYSCYRPVGHIEVRLESLAATIEQANADIVFL
jgi:endonuclease/exonuclease/phosphatase family metal-dependent hydrolase